MTSTAAKLLMGVLSVTGNLSQEATNGKAPTKPLCAPKWSLILLSFQGLSKLGTLDAPTFGEYLTNNVSLRLGSASMGCR